MARRPEEPAPCAFFCHIMKTGGSSLAAMISRQIPDRRMIAPSLEHDHFWAYVMNPLHWTGLFGDLSEVRYVAGHYPFLAHTLLPVPHKTLALFREPVSRVISHLGELQREARLRASRPGEQHPSAKLVQRIREDMVWDLRFYEAVLERYARQAQSRTAP